MSSWLNEYSGINSNIRISFFILKYNNTNLKVPSDTKSDTLNTKSDTIEISELLPFF